KTLDRGDNNMRVNTPFLIAITIAGGVAFAQACGGSDKGGTNFTSGGSGSGGTASGGTNSGGAASGGTSAGGTDSNATSSGGTASGGSSSGGTGVGGGAGETGSGGSGSGSGGAGGDGPVGPVCGGFGEDCNSPDDCCSEVCDSATNTCGRNVIECKELGGDCENNSDCCSFHCDEGSCSETACIDDGDECAYDEECCSGTCADGACGDVNGGSHTCKSSGNSCDEGSDCCSGLCDDGRCSQQVSYCVQLGDICNGNSDCCTGNCVKSSDDATYGYCEVLEVGPERCKTGQAGMICGTDCAGCCSRACGPGPAGVFICQPPSGCRPAGELCVRDTDCCGGDPSSGLPGSGESDAFCERENADDVFGRCKSQRCTPQGDVCQLKEGLCSESSQLPSNCCPTNANP